MKIKELKSEVDVISDTEMYTPFGSDDNDVNFDVNL